MATLTAAPSPQGTTPSRSAPPHRGRIVAGVIGAVLLVLAGLAVWWLVSQPDGVDVVAVDAATSEVLVDLDAAQTTAEVRGAAAAAASEAAVVQAALAEGGSDQDTEFAARARLRVLAEAASLASLTAETLDDWSAVRPRLTQALGALPTDAAELKSAGDLAVASLDELVAQGQAAMAAWAAARDAAVAAGQQNLALAAAVDSYRGTASTQLALYESLRSQTTAVVKLLRNEAIDEDLWKVYTQLSAGERDREAVLAALGATAVPAGLEEVHNRMLAMVQDSVVAMRAVQRAIDEASNARYQDYNGTGPVPPLLITQAPSWQTFITTSDRIDKELPAVQAAVAERADDLIAEYRQQVPVPPKPTV